MAPVAYDLEAFFGGLQDDTGWQDCAFHFRAHRTWIEWHHGIEQLNYRDRVYVEKAGPGMRMHP